VSAKNVGRHTPLGPVVSKSQYDKIHAFISGAKAAGIRCISPSRGSAPPPSSGYYVAPHVFDDVTPDARIWREEIFGPVRRWPAVDPCAADPLL